MVQQDQAEAIIRSKQNENAQAAVSLLDQRHKEEMDVAMRGNGDIIALIQRQAIEKANAIKATRAAQEQAIAEDYEAQYAILDAAGVSTLELQQQHAEAINAMKAGFRAQDEADAQASADRMVAVLQQANAVELGLMQDMGSLMGEAMSGQLKDAKEFQKAFLLIMLKAAKAQIQLEMAKASAAALASPESVATFGVAGLAKAALLQGLIEGLFSGLAAMVQGFAGGGTVPDERGTVTSSWGKPIRRSNGDDVLVTLKRKEKVLNADQIARAEAIAGKGFWGRIGLPNHPTYASTTAFLTDQQAPRKQRIAGYAIGGTVGYIASPTVAELSTERNVAELRAINFQPVVSVVEINKVQNRTRVAESLSTA